MTINEFLTYLTRIFFVLLSGITMASFIRHRDKSRWDIAMMSLSLSTGIFVQVLLTITGWNLPWLTRLGSLAVEAQPYLLLRLVQHFQPVPVAIKRSALLGMVASWIITLFGKTPASPLASLVVVTYFAAINGYAIVAFVRGTLSNVGVVRQRLRFAAAGSGFLVAILLIAGLRTFIPTLAPLVVPLSQFGAILCALAYYLGFAPPRWLRQAWQLAELRNYLLSVQKATNKRNIEILAQLHGAVVQAMGAKAKVAIALRDTTSNQLTIQKISDSALLSDTDVNGVEVIKQAWQEGVPIAVSRSADLGNESVRLMMQAAGMESLLIVPIATNERVSGLLMVFLQNNSLFIDDDLSLLSIFARETAIVLENNIVLEELHHYAQDLEQKVQKRTDALQTSEAELRALFTAMNDIIVVVDSQGKYLKIAPTNPTPLVKLPDDLIGKTLYDVFPAPQAESLLTSIRTALATQHTTNVEYRTTTEDKDIWFTANLSPMIEDAVIWVARDISERKEAEERLKHFALELQRSNEEFQQFAYIASHDLQEPLRMVGSYLQLIETRYAEKLDGEAREFIAFAVDGAAHMKNLISGLLTYSHVETEPKNFTQINTQKTFDEACKLLEVAIGETQAIVTSNSLPNIRADERLIIQLFQNLIGNAIKYRSDRKPEIHVGVKHNSKVWGFSVRDNGIGIEPQYLERIFVIFQRLHNRGKYPGTGIGLAVCKKVVERHGGRIWVESEIGKGTTIYFTIPE